MPVGQISPGCVKNVLQQFYFSSNGLEEIVETTYVE